MNKNELIASVADQASITKAQASEAVDAVLGGITSALSKGDEVRLVGFGNFVVREKKARVGRNPQTGRDIEISARRVLTFKPPQVLKDQLNT